MYLNFQKAKTVTRDYTDRLVLKGDELQALKRIVAASRYADPKAGLPLTPDTAFDANLARSILGLPTVDTFSVDEVNVTYDPDEVVGFMQVDPDSGEVSYPVF